jgi:hypothetical protein
MVKYGKNEKLIDQSRIVIQLFILSVFFFWLLNCRFSAHLAFTKDLLILNWLFEESPY